MKICFYLFNKSFKNRRTKLPCQSMSKTECRGAAVRNRCRFKGVENFLKRVAYNLGNSPSQTEVKIISCIPIDVSDLQQKILCLEKQLEETKCFQMSTSQKPIINTVICECPTVSNNGVSCNMLDIDRGTSPHKPHHSHSKHSSRKKSSVTFATPYKNTCSCHTVDTITPERKHFNVLDPYAMDTSRCNEGKKNFFKKKKKGFKCKKPKVHCICYAQTECNPFNINNNKIGMVSKDTEVMTRSYLSEMINKQYKPRPLGVILSDISKFSSPVCRDTQNYNTTSFYESDLCSCFHAGFENIDKHFRNHNLYLNQPSNLLTERGYYDSSLYDVVPVKEKSTKVKKYLNRPKKEELRYFFDDKISPEVLDTKLRTYSMYNSLHINKYDQSPRIENNLHKIKKINRREPISLIRNLAKCRNKVPNMDKKINVQESKSCFLNFCNAQQYPKVINTTSKVDTDVTQVPLKSDAQCLTTIANNNGCQTVTEIDEPNLNNKTENTLSQIKSILQSVLQEVKITSALKCTADDKIRQDAGVNKNISQSNAKSQHHNMQSNLLHNKGENVQADMLGNITGNLPSSLPGNVIRSQNYMADNISGVIPTYAQMPSHIQGSTLLNSFTYSPYNTNQCIPTCLKQLHSNLYCYPPNGFKYIYNYPLLIHNPERHPCFNCYQQNSNLMPRCHKQMTTAATNTDRDNEATGNETHKLIKEIYKSVAISMNVDNKDNSLSEVGIVQESPNNSDKVDVSKKKVDQKLQHIKGIKPATTNVQPVAELFITKNTWVSSESNNRKIQNTPESIDIGAYSQEVTDVKIKHLKPSPVNIIKFEKQNISNVNPQAEQKLCRKTTQDSGVSTTSETEMTTSQTDTDDNTVQPQLKNKQESRKKTEKLSLFAKMLKSVKLFRQRDKNKFVKKEDSIETQESEEVSSDSDDYQTIYSHKIYRPVKHTPRAHFFKRRTHSKISYKQAFQRDKSPTYAFRRSPYMEQEYRRHWNERLMFSNKYRQSSEPLTYSYDYSSDSRILPFYQRYEARTALVHPKKTLKPRNVKRVILPKVAAKTELNATL